MIHINNQLIDQVSEKAKNSERNRMNYNFHTDLSDTLQRLLNAMEPGTYVQPHKHENPDKDEAFILLRGKALVVEFDPNGNITDHTILDYKSGNYGVEIKSRTFHSIVILEPGTVLYEVKHGPYLKIDDKCFASWAPREGEPGCKEFISQILKKLNIQ